ncbi:hypothetical protein CC2G_003459 [Coprinopsis cinerea AmutBmut pab1-1]|nr:hypothetical protein CC2G_003459 [Coprinopsis cinerea AmutBmut pab1-1]
MSPSPMSDMRSRIHSYNLDSQWLSSMWMRAKHLILFVYDPETNLLLLRLLIRCDDHRKWLVPLLHLPPQNFTLPSSTSVHLSTRIHSYLYQHRNSVSMVLVLLHRHPSSSSHTVNDNDDLQGLPYVFVCPVSSGVVHHTHDSRNPMSDVGLRLVSHSDHANHRTVARHNDV